MTTNPILSCLLASISFHSQSALAGNWSSGGGEILGNAQNPWFLETGATTKPIRYCIAAAPEFAVSQPDLEKIVRSSFSWWNDQFGNALSINNETYSGGNKPAQLKFFVNTSRILYEDCSAETDLKFQFGYLDAKQLEKFEKEKIDRTRFVGLSIRTDYSKDLRGKGFIYISPDRGPDAFKGENVRIEAWTADDNRFDRLSSVLSHELGHVFGLLHSQEPDTLMNARHAESIVSKVFNKTSIEALIAKNNPVFFPKAGLGTIDCGASNDSLKARAFFGIDPSSVCFKVQLNLNELRVEVTDSAADQRYEKLGVARFADGGQRRIKSLVSLWLPEKQTLFPMLPELGNSVLLGAASQEFQNTAAFVNTKTGLKRQIFVQAGPRYFQIGGMGDNGLDLDLLSNNLYGRLLSGWINK